MTAPVQEGDVLAGKYRVDKVLGVGGMGVVVAAHHIHLDEKVAIKFLLPDMLQSAEAVGRFAREARAAVKIKSEHVARVSDVGTLENGAPYMVMEYLEGGDLAGWLEQRGPLPVEQAVEFVLQACEALAEAHGLGIVHRDLKPANLYVIRRPDGLLSVKVLDFGISKVTASSGSGSDMSMTKTTAVMGSPFYMSPEQLESAKGVDARTDIWAMGIVLHELIVGRAPFQGEALTELILKIVSAEPEPLRNLRPDAPEGLQAVVSKCLQKDRTKRYANVAELAVALGPFGPRRGRESVERIGRIIQHSGLSASALGMPAASEPPPRPAAGGTASSWGQSAPGLQQDRKVAFGGLAIVAVIGLGLATYLVRRGAGEANRPEPAAATANAVGVPAASPTPSAPSIASPAEVPVLPAVPEAPAASASAVPPSVVPAPPQAARAVAHPPVPTAAKAAPAAHRPSAPAAPAAPAPPATPAPVKKSTMFDDRK